MSHCVNKSEYKKQQNDMCYIMMYFLCITSYKVAHQSYISLWNCYRKVETVKQQTDEKLI
jgi:hypothetical protein